MKNNIKFLLIGLIIGVIIATSSVFALTGSVQKNLNYNNIKITLNGEEITPTDANGTYVEPFTIDGTTYLPVRAIANALGLEVDWDGTTNTVVLGNDTSSSSEGSVIYDKNGIKITYTGPSPYTNNTYDIMIENNSDKYCSIETHGVYANDFAMSSGSFFAVGVDSGKKAMRSIALREDILKNCGITNVENIEIILEFNSSNVDETITIHP